MIGTLDCTYRSKDSREGEVTFLLASGFGRLNWNAGSNSWTQINQMLAHKKLSRFGLGRGKRCEDRVIKQVIEEQLKPIGMMMLMVIATFYLKSKYQELDRVFKHA